MLPNLKKGTNLKELVSKETLGAWLETPNKWIHKVESTFEKESGWKHRTVKETLKNFTKLNRRSQLLFGGLLVGRALFSVEKPGEAKRTRAQKTESSGAPRGTAQPDSPAPSVEVAAAAEPSSEGAAQA